jgi:hypothetical protein
MRASATVDGTVTASGTVWKTMGMSAVWYAPDGGFAVRARFGKSPKYR